MIKYRKIEGYKYQLAEEYWLMTELRPEKDVAAPEGNPFIELHQNGVLIIKSGYAWDGASGPAIDTKTIIRGSLVHDALYQLMRAGKISRDNRLYVDELFVKICREDGMSKLRCWWVFQGVHRFAGRFTKKGSGTEAKIYKAP